MRQCVMGEKGTTMTKLSAGAAVLAVIAVLGATAWVALSPNAEDAFAACSAGQVAGGAAAIGGPFTLVDQTGKTVTDAEVITRPTLIYFGYAFCPDVCPVDNARNAEAVDILEERGLDVNLVFVSVDPGRDTPEALAEYAANLHPRMVALTGTDDQISKASQAYKAYFKVQDSGDEFYLVDHSTFTYLMLPDTGFADFFRREVTPDEMADRVACFIGEA